MNIRFMNILWAANSLEINMAIICIGQRVLVHPAHWNLSRQEGYKLAVSVERVLKECGHDKIYGCKQ